MKIGFKNKQTPWFFVGLQYTGRTLDSSSAHPKSQNYWQKHLFYLFRGCSIRRPKQYWWADLSSLSAFIRWQLTGSSGVVEWSEEIKVRAWRVKDFSRPTSKLPARCWWIHWDPLNRHQMEEVWEKSCIKAWDEIIATSDTGVQIMGRIL